MNPNEYTAKQVTDEALWQSVLLDDTSAFEAVVERYKGSVSAVAYCILGNMARCQEISQETFWTAWKQRAQLREPSKLASWLCGIARNLARQSLKTEYSKFSAENIESWDVASTELDPALASVTREENELLWNALESLPDIYREALAIFYRQGESVAYVASSQDVSIDTAKQRLSRGRELLKSHLANLVEEVLCRSTPSRSFTSRVMLGIAAWTVAMKATGAVASSAAGGVVTGGIAKGVSSLGVSTLSKGVASVAVTGSTAGVLGGLAGGIGGLGGAWFGTWLPTQLARTTQESDVHRLHGKRIFRDAVIFTVALLAATGLFWVPMGFYLYWCAWASLMVWFFVSLSIHIVQLNKKLLAIQMLDPKDLTPNENPLRHRMSHYRWEGVRYTSPWKLFGIPLIDLQFSDLRFDGQGQLKVAHARGWIAIGDRATGCLVAMGGRAVGLIALGGVAFGGLAFGGVALGGLCVGGLAIGMVAMGGGAIGYDAVGGAAIAWNSAAGGLAIAKHAAAGGLAWAMDYAMGGQAFAQVANTEDAKAYVSQKSFIWLLEWYVRNQSLGLTILLAPALLLSFCIRFFYRKVVDTQSTTMTMGETK